MAKFDKILFDIINERRQRLATQPTDNEAEENSGPVDLLELMLLSQDQESLTDKELRDNMILFFLAGHDTTSTSLTMVLYQLAKNIEYQNKVRDEVIKISGSKKIPSFDDQKKFEFMNKVLKESSRLFPSVTNVVARKAIKDTVLTRPDEPDIVVPKDTVVGINLFVIHHKESLWGPDVDVFRPERFQAKTEEEEEKLFSQHVPFAAGPRACIGQEFSLIEQRMILSSILIAFDLKLVSPDEANGEKLLFGRSGLLHPTNISIQFIPRS